MSSIKRVLEELNDTKQENIFYKQYTTYLRQWYKDHAAPEYESMEPVSFEEFVDNEAKLMSTYTVTVDINEASHVIADYTKVIEVKASQHLTMDQLKFYIDTLSPYSIEDRVAPQVDTPDAVEVEIYDYDLTLIKEVEEE